MMIHDPIHGKSWSLTLLDECMRSALARAERCIIERKVIEKFCNAANINVVFFDYLSKMNNLATSSAE
jgi:hypothetical protein